MPQSPALAFANNLVESFMQYKALQFQKDLALRREKRYDQQLEENRMIRQSQFELQRQTQEHRAEQLEETRTYHQGMLGLRAEQLNKPKFQLTDIGAYKGVFDPTEGTISPTVFPSSKVPETTVNVGAGTSALEKSTKGRIEDEIKKVDDILRNINAIEMSTEDEFLTYTGQATNAWTRFGEKAKLELPWTNQDFMRRYSAWMVPAQEQFLQKRHEITGVAAPPQEKPEIAKAVPDPTKNSPTEFRSKLTTLKGLLNSSRNYLIKLRSQGIETVPDEIAGPSNNIDVSDVDLRDLEGLF